MSHEALAHAAAVVGAFGACGLLLARERLLFFGGLAAFVRYPAAAPVALLVVAPFRLSIGLGSQEAFLLLPLYAVLAAAGAALAYRVLRGSEFPAVPNLIAAPTAALVALSGDRKSTRL